MNHSSFANSVERAPWHVEVRTCDKCGHIGPLVLKRITLMGKPLLCNRCFQQRGSALVDVVGVMVTVVLLVFIGFTLARVTMPVPCVRVDNLVDTVPAIELYPEVVVSPC